MTRTGQRTNTVATKGMGRIPGNTFLMGSERHYPEQGRSGWCEQDNRGC